MTTEQQLKGFYTFLGAALISLPLVIIGCGQDSPKPPPPDYIGNSQANDITEHEKLVEIYGTTEVANIPSDSHEFVVRDTNGVVWYVRTKDYPGRTRLFGWHPEFPKYVEPAPVLVTNIVTETNTVTITNHIVEDPTK